MAVQNHAEEKVEVYREERTRIPVFVSIAVLLLIAAPLLYWIWQIQKEGIQAANVTQYRALVELVDADVQTVSAMLNNDTRELEAIQISRKAPVVTLVVPEIVIVDEQKNIEPGAARLDVTVEGIYWSPKNPLVSLSGETYRIGDRIQDYEIVRITKTAVQFQAPDGTIVMKDMYENLLEKSKR